MYQNGKESFDSSASFGNYKIDVSFIHGSQLDIEIQSDVRDFICIEFDNSFMTEKKHSLIYHKALASFGSTRERLYIDTAIKESRLCSGSDFTISKGYPTQYTDIPIGLSEEEYFMFSTVHKLPDYSELMEHSKLFEFIEHNLPDTSARISYILDEIDTSILERICECTRKLLHVCD